LGGRQKKKKEGLARAEEGKRPSSAIRREYNFYRLAKRLTEIPSETFIPYGERRGICISLETSRGLSSHCERGGVTFLKTASEEEGQEDCRHPKENGQVSGGELFVWQNGVVKKKDKVELLSSGKKGGGGNEHRRGVGENIHCLPALSRGPYRGEKRQCVSP